MDTVVASSLIAKAPAALRSLPTAVPAAQPPQAAVLALGQLITFSQPLQVDLVVYRGDSGRFRVSVSDPVGAPLDVTAATWDCDIRTTEDAEPPMTSLDVNPVPGQPNTVEVVLDAATSADLANGVWDLEMTLNGEVQTLMKGKVTVQKDVSRS